MRVDGSDSTGVGTIMIEGMMEMIGMMGPAATLHGIMETNNKHESSCHLQHFPEVDARR